MKTRLAAAWLMALVVLTAAILTTGIAIAQEPTMGLDADPTGNTGTSLGPIDDCASVGSGDRFQIDLFVTDVNDLKGWEAYLTFDGDIVNVTDVDVYMFQAANSGSDVFDVSESLPSTGGLYRLGAIDIGDPAASDSGSGVLARIALTAVGAGLSPAFLTFRDENEDGRIDLGPRLVNSDEVSIGDSNGDDIFDGPRHGMHIAVDRECPEAPAATPAPSSPTPSGSPTDGAMPGATGAETATSTATANVDEDDGIVWTSGGFIAGYVVASLVVALLLGGVAVVLARRRSL